MRFALIHFDYKVAIKTRDAERYLSYSKELYCKHIGKKIPKNLSIINRAYPEHLILNSIAVLGFNSTILIEALIANKMIISPDFSEVFRDFKSPGVFNGFEDLSHCMKNYNELEELILNSEGQMPIDVEIKNEFLEPIVFKYDGKSNQRIER